MEGGVPDELGVTEEEPEGDVPGGSEVVGVGAPVGDGHTTAARDTRVTLPPGENAATVADPLVVGATRPPDDHVA